MKSMMKSVRKGSPSYPRKRADERVAGAEGRAAFDLTFGDTVVGHLEYANDTWIFVYDAAFRNQKRMRPIVGFRDTGKEYRSKRLWPFFRTRIPSTQQPAVGAVVRRERIDPNDAVVMLQRFGRRTISNPFELEPVHR